MSSIRSTPVMIPHVLGGSLNSSSCTIGTPKTPPSPRPLPRGLWTPEVTGIGPRRYAQREDGRGGVYGSNRDSRRPWGPGKGSSRERERSEREPELDGNVDIGTSKEESEGHPSPRAADGVTSWVTAPPPCVDAGETETRVRRGRPGSRQVQVPYPRPRPANRTCVYPPDGPRLRSTVVLT